MVVPEERVDALQVEEHRSQDELLSISKCPGRAQQPELVPTLVCAPALRCPPLAKMCSTPGCHQPHGHMGLHDGEKTCQLPADVIMTRKTLANHFPVNFESLGSSSMPVVSLTDEVKPGEPLTATASEWVSTSLLDADLPFTAAALVDVDADIYGAVLEGTRRLNEHAFAVGAVVSARHQQGARFFDGWVRSVHPPNGRSSSFTYGIEYEDGDAEEHLPERFIIFRNPDDDEVLPEVHIVGDAVRARFGGHPRSRFFDGVITGCHQRGSRLFYDILYVVSS